MINVSTKIKKAEKSISTSKAKKRQLKSNFTEDCICIVINATKKHLMN